MYPIKDEALIRSKQEIPSEVLTSESSDKTESHFYLNFLPRNGVDPTHNSQSKWRLFVIAFSVTCACIVKGPPRKEWPILYAIAVLTTKRILEKIASHPDPLAHQNQLMSKAARIPKSANLSIEYFNTNPRAIEFFRRTSPGEWPNFSKNVGPIYGEFIATNTADNSSVILSFHGGMHVSGSAQSYRAVNYNLSIASGAVIFAINYRLAPLNPYPCGMIDSLTAYLFLIQENP